MFKAVLAYAYSADAIKVVEGEGLGTFIEPIVDFPASSLPYVEIFIPEGSNKKLAQVRLTSECFKYLHGNRAIEKLIPYLL